MLKCSKCGSEIPSQSRYCLGCGEAVPGTGPQTQPAAPGKRVGLWAAIAGVLVVAAVVAFIAGRGKVMEATPVPSPQQGPVLKAPETPGAPQPSVLQTDVEKPPLDLEKEEKPQPPAEVVAYLEHLKRVEATRMALQEKEIRVLSMMLAQAWAEPLQKMLKLTDPDATEEDLGKSSANLKKEMATLTREWQQLSAYFLSVQPPPQCNELAGKYYGALREVIGQIIKLEGYLASQDLNVLNMRGQSRTIDEKLMAADAELTRVCNEHNIEKTFRIQADTAQIPILGF